MVRVRVSIAILAERIRRQNFGDRPTHGMTARRFRAPTERGAIARTLSLLPASFVVRTHLGV